MDHIREQAAGAGTVTTRPMFGEYALYCDGRLVALICDDRLFLKPTAAGRRLLDPVEEAPPYPGAKPFLVVSAELWDEADRLAELVRASAAELPPPKTKRRC